jgi:hypothetical protein
MPNYNTDSEINFDFTVRFYAVTQADADNIASNLINRIFGSAAAGLMSLDTPTSVNLSGQAISGANWTYPYHLKQRWGASDAATPVYNTVFASTAANALAQLQAAASRVTGLQNFPLRILYLQ